MARTSVESQLAKIRKAKADLEKKEQALLNQTQNRIVERIVQLVVDNDISLAQIEDALKAGKSNPAANSADSPRNKVPPKYCNPANPQQLWTGRGLAPVWARELQAAGNLDTALIAPAPVGTPAD